VLVSFFRGGSRCYCNLVVDLHYLLFSVDVNNVKFRKYVGKDIRLETMEKDVGATITYVIISLCALISL
jgi:hypothetical protein